MSEGGAVTWRLDAKNITHGRFVYAGLVAEKGIVIARRKAIACTPPHNNVVAAGGERTRHRPPANGHVFLTTCQGVSAMLPRAVLAPSEAVVPLKLVSAESPTATLTRWLCFP